MSTTPNGLKKITIYVRPDQYLRLRGEQVARVVDKGGGRPDVSARLRAMIDLCYEAEDAAASAKRTLRRHQR